MAASCIDASFCLKCKLVVLNCKNARILIGNVVINSQSIKRAYGPSRLGRMETQLLFQWLFFLVELLTVFLFSVQIEPSALKLQRLDSGLFTTGISFVISHLVLLWSRKTAIFSYKRERFCISTTFTGKLVRHSLCTGL